MTGIIHSNCLNVDKLSLKTAFLNSEPYLNSDPTLNFMYFSLGKFINLLLLIIIIINNKLFITTFIVFP